MKRLFFRFDPEKNKLAIDLTVPAFWLRLVAATERANEWAAHFLGGRRGLTFIWPRWIFLRLLGFAFLTAFVIWCREGAALFWLNGNVSADVPLSTVNATAALAPWLSVGGLIAAVALVLNFWPRAALAVCWVSFFSLLTGTDLFFLPEFDTLLLDTAFLALFLVPRGFAPGRGEQSAPLPIVVFLLRLLMARVLLGTGLSRISGEAALWSAPPMAIFPTFFGFLSHQAPETFRLAGRAIALTAQFIAPFLLFCGRSPRIIGFALICVTQLWAMLAANMGWLSINMIALAFLMLDDEILERRHPRMKNPGFTPARASMLAPVAATLLLLHSYASLWSSAEHFFPSLHESPAWSTIFAWPSSWGARLHIAESYDLENARLTGRRHVAFDGTDDYYSSDWRTFEYRQLPQMPRQISAGWPFLFSRFEAGMPDLSGEEDTRVRATAAYLLLGVPEVRALFARNPLPGQHAHTIRFGVFEFAFTDFATWRRSGAYFTRSVVSRVSYPLVYEEKFGTVHFIRGRSE